MSVLVYTAANDRCPACRRAKALLEYAAIAYSEAPVTRANKAHFQAVTNGARTVPQVFVLGHHIGGFDELKALHDSGRLHALLQTRDPVGDPT